MKSEPIEDCPALAEFYAKLSSTLHARSINSLITGGVACVLYGLTQKTKDCDIIVPVERVPAVLDVLAAFELQGHKCHVTGHFETSQLGSIQNQPL